MSEINPLPDLLFEFRRHKDLADRALAQLDDESFFHRPAPHVNPVAVIVKHLAGNLLSRWTDFLITDGEKPARDRDSEFILGDQDSRASLMAAWERGWAALFENTNPLTLTDLDRTVDIRAEPFTVYQALVRGLTHAAYHTGQILYLTRLFKPDSQWLSIPPGMSNAARGGYRTPR